MIDRPHVVESREIYRGKVFTLRVDTVEEGGERRNIDIVEHPGSYAVAPINDDGRLVLVRQYRHAAGRAIWEIPAGAAHPGEALEEGARRELREETGYTADTLQLMCSVYPTPGYCTELLHIYVARGLHAGEQALDEDERIEVRDYSVDQVWQMQASGEIVDMKTLAALLWLASGQDK